METKKTKNTNKINEIVPISVSFKIVDIKLIKFAYEPVDEKEKNVILDDFTFEINFRYETSKEKKSLVTYVYTEIFKDQEKTNSLGHIETKMEFLLINFDEITSIEKGVQKILNVALNIFISVSISTARGMLASKTSGTPLEKAYLPVINANDILKSTLSQK